MRSLGQLVAGVAHEINNPIGFVKNNLVYLQEKMKWLWENRDSKEVKEKAEKAYNRCVEIFMPEAFARRIDERLKKIK
jgi:signal transduction histidine kinase